MILQKLSVAFIVLKIENNNNNDNDNYNNNDNDNNNIINKLKIDK